MGVGEGRARVAAAARYEQRWRRCGQRQRAGAARLRPPPHHARCPRPGPPPEPGLQVAGRCQTQTLPSTITNTADLCALSAHQAVHLVHQQPEGVDQAVGGEDGCAQAPGRHPDHCQAQHHDGPLEHAPGCVDGRVGGWARRARRRERGGRAGTGPPRLHAVQVQATGAEAAGRLCRQQRRQPAAPNGAPVTVSQPLRSTALKPCG